MSSQQSPISIRLDEEITADIDAYKASDPLRYRGSRSRAMYDLLCMALYDNDQMRSIMLTCRFVFIDI